MPPNETNISRFVLSDFPALTSIFIGANCFTSTSTFSVSNCNRLRDIQIMDGCFLPYSNKETFLQLSSYSSFSIENCNSLKQLDIHPNSFVHYSKFNLSSLGNLQTIRIGRMNTSSSCFYYSTRFELTNLPRLQTVELGDYSFFYVNKICMMNAPALTELHIGDRALYGDMNALYQNTIELDGRSAMKW